MCTFSCAFVWYRGFPDGLSALFNFTTFFAIIVPPRDLPGETFMTTRDFAIATILYRVPS